MGASWIVSGGRFKQQRGSRSPLYKCVPVLCGKVFLLLRPLLPPLQKCVCKLYHPSRLLWCYYVKAAHLIAPEIIYNLALRSCNPGLQVCVHPVSNSSPFGRWDGSGGSTVCRAQLRLSRLGAPLGQRARGTGCSLQGCCMGALVVICEHESVSWAVMSPGRPSRVHPLQRWGCLLPTECRQGVISPRKLLGAETNT